MGRRWNWIAVLAHGFEVGVYRVVHPFGCVVRRGLIRDLDDIADSLVNNTLDVASQFLTDAH